MIETINKAFIEHFKHDPDMESIYGFDLLNNQYKIIVICNAVNKYKLKVFYKFLNKLCQELSTDKINIKYNCLVGPNNQECNNNILIQTFIYSKEEIKHLSNMEKYNLAKEYKLVYGKDTLKEYENTKYSIENILNGYEGIYFFLDKLKRRQTYDLHWKIENDIVELKYHSKFIKEENKIEFCMYSINKIINYVVNYCKFNNYEIPNDKIMFCIKLLGQVNITEDNLFLLQGLLSYDKSLLNAIFANPYNETILLLEQIKYCITELDIIFPKKEDRRTKILNRHKKYLLRS